MGAEDNRNGIHRSAMAEPASTASARIAQTTPAQNKSNQTAAGSANAAAAPPPSGIPACDKPGGMGLSRIVEIDTTGGPGFGFEHFKQYDFLRDKEVVLTFDDGPVAGEHHGRRQGAYQRVFEGHLL